MYDKHRKKLNDLVRFYDVRSNELYQIEGQWGTAEEVSHSISLIPDPPIRPLLPFIFLSMASSSLNFRFFFFSLLINLFNFSIQHVFCRRAN